MSFSKVTLGTNVLQELWQDRARRAVVERLLALAEEKGLDLAITTDYRSVLAEVLTTRLRASSTAGVFPDFRPSSLGLLNPR